MVDLSNMTHHYARKRPRIVVPDGCFRRRVLGKAVPPLWCALISSSSKRKAALCNPICPASTMAAPKNTTSNGSDFWRRDGIAQALRNKIIQLPSGLLVLPSPVSPWGAAGRRVAGESWGCSVRWTASFRRTGSQQPVRFRTPF